MYHEQDHESLPQGALRWLLHDSEYTLVQSDGDCPWSCPIHLIRYLQTAQIDKHITATKEKNSSLYLLQRTIHIIYWIEHSHLN